MKTIKLAYDAENTNGGWFVKDHEGDTKFYAGCLDQVCDHMQRITLPNWGMRLIAVR